MSIRPFWLQRIVWAYQEGAMWSRFVEWLTMRAAWALPRSVALWAFVRVYACDGEAPGPEYTRVYDAWQKGKGR